MPVIDRLELPSLNAMFVCLSCDSSADSFPSMEFDQNSSLLSLCFSLRTRHQSMTSLK